MLAVEQARWLAQDLNLLHGRFPNGFAPFFRDCRNFLEPWAALVDNTNPFHWYGAAAERLGPFVGKSANGVHAMSHTHRPSRRLFLKAAAGAVAAPYIIPSSAWGAADRPAPSNRLTIGCVGIKNMGGGHLGTLLGNRDVQVLAVCDVDGQIREAGRNRANSIYARDAASGAYKGCDAYNDFRELVQRKDIDAVMCATPDHWHTLVSLAALKSGKDVYCEKPLTLTIQEGRILADTARRYGRILQTGSQQRSANNFRFACELVRNGRIGKVHSVKVGIPGNNKSAPVYKEEPIPPYFDYNMWLGPAPYEPYCSDRCHYNFRFILDYSGGQVTNWGAHHLDIAQWGLGMDDSGPVEIDGRGSEFPASGLFNTATKVHFVCTYANGTKLTCATGGSGTRFEGEKGWVYVDRGKLQAEPASLLTSTIGPNEIHLYESRSHWANFFDCIKSRRDPICKAEVGHRSSTVCHLGNIAMVLGRSVKWDPKAERFINDEEAHRMASRPLRAPWCL